MQKYRENFFKNSFDQMPSRAQVLTFRVMQYIEEKRFYLQCGVYGYQLTQNFPQIPKI
jgi:hypothetical protein